MKIKDIVEARMSAAVKLQRAFEREQSKSTASKERADQAKAEFEKTWKAKQEKEKQGVAEEINPDILDPRFSHTQQIGDYTYIASVEIFLDEPILNIKAYDGDKEIGHVLFEIFDWEDDTSNSYMESGGTEVDPKYRGKGIATTMYAYAKMLGNDIIPSFNRTTQGKAMWAGWGQDAKHLRDVTEGIDELARVLELSGLNLTADEQFDIIEEMVESLALEHGVDAETIWEEFESVDDHELFEAAAWQKKSGKSKTGGLNAKGVASYRRENPGSKLQMAVTTKPSKLKPGSKAAKRRKSFCARMGGNKGPMKKPNGKPTRKALALRKWNC